VGQHDWVVGALADRAFTVFDTETTGLDPRSCRLVEIGGIRFDGRGVISRFNVLIDPGIPMPSEVTKINGITDAMLKGKPAAAAVLPDFLRFVGDSVLVAHNAPFDLSFVNEELARVGGKPLANRVVDTRLFAREVFPGLPKYALQDLAVRLGIEALEAHRAEDDARVCMELFLRCVAALVERNPALGAAAPSQVAGSTAEKPPVATATQSHKPPAAADDLFQDEEEQYEIEGDDQSL